MSCSVRISSISRKEVSPGVAYDALNRNESCGGHFREEYQTEEGEAKRDDENFFYVVQCIVSNKFTHCDEVVQADCFVKLYVHAFFRTGDKQVGCFTLKVWRQAGPKAKGAFETYQMKDIPGDTSFLESLPLSP